MQSVLPVYLLTFGIVIAAAFFFSRSDEQISRKMAKVRVRVDDSRRGRQMPEPPEEEFETVSALQWTLGAVIILLIVMLISSL